MTHDTGTMMERPRHVTRTDRVLGNCLQGVGAAMLLVGLGMVLGYGGVLIFVGAGMIIFGAVVTAP